MYVQFLAISRENRGTPRHADCTVAGKHNPPPSTVSRKEIGGGLKPNTIAFHLFAGVVLELPSPVGRGSSPSVEVST
jgi:hypothetical protein